MRLRRLHQLIGLVIFLPALFWGLSGAFLAWKNWARDGRGPDAGRELIKRPFRVELARALSATEQPPGAEPRSIEWQHFGSAPYFVITYKGSPSPVLIDGETGQRVPRITPELATQIAAAEAPDAQVSGCVLQDEHTLVYLDSMELPVYRVALSDGSSVYISPTSGQVHFRAPRLSFLIRFAFYKLHVFKWADSRHTYLVLLVLGLLQCASSVTGLWLWLSMRSASRRRAIRDTPRA